MPMKTGSVSCKACDAGYSCLDPANTPKPCAAGEHSISGQSTCTVSSIVLLLEGVSETPYISV